MGLMPPYDPFQDPALAWAVGRVASITPPAPTWSRPGVVVLAVDEVLRGDVPPRIAIAFGPPREAGDEHFYLTRGLGPPPWTAEQEATLARQRAELDARPIEVPDVGASIVVWLARDPDGSWHVPTLRTLGAAMPVPMRSRWIDAAHLDAVRARIAS